VYLYGQNFNTANANYYQQFTAITNFTAFQISNLVHNPTSTISLFMTT